MRMLAIACAGVIGLAGSSAWAACNWSTAKADDVLASATVSSSTPVQSTPAETAPVRLPEGDKQG